MEKEIVEQMLGNPLGEAAYRVVEKLEDAGCEAWWVGGCVRDMLRGTLPTEVDIATSTLPDQVVSLFRGCEEEGKTFGSVRVQQTGHRFEVTTFREDDDASDGRRPESVVFGSRAADAARRDITINALYWHPIRRELYDPFEGEADLRERLIRFIGDPATRIKHDALRMLRVIRFRAAIRGQFEPETYRALQELASHVEVLSGSRVLDELEKMLLGPHPDRALEDLWETRILSFILPELYACKGIAQPADYHREGDVWEHTLACTRAFRSDDDRDIRLTALFHDCGKVQTFARRERIRFDEHASVSAKLTADALDRLQCPAARRDKICWIIRHHMMMGAFENMGDETKAHWYYHPWFTALIRLFEIDIAGTDPADYTLYQKIVQDYRSYLDSHPRLPKTLLSGDDIMAILGVRPGPHVGEVLHELLAAQLQGTIATKADARAFVDRMR